MDAPDPDLAVLAEYEGLRGLLEQIETPFRDRFSAILEPIDLVCDEHLGALAEEYRATCQLLAAACCQEGTPVVEGHARAESWAAGILWTVGWVNFLSDAQSEPHLSAKQAAAAFGVSVATMEAKCRDIRRGLDVRPCDMRWTLPTLARANPLIWLIESPTAAVDARTLPLEAQQALVEARLIPFVVEDYDETVDEGQQRFAALLNEFAERAGIELEELD
ncbi:MAG: DUF6398 domain-containing protein [Planctomycetota bacterium]